MASREITFSVHDIPEVQEMVADLVRERDEARAALAERDATIARVRVLIDSARLVDHSQGVGPRLFDATEIRRALDGPL